MNGKCCKFCKTQRDKDEEEEGVKRLRWLLSAEMWFPLPLTPTSCLCYFCHNLCSISLPLTSSLSLFLSHVSSSPSLLFSFISCCFLLSASVLFLPPTFSFCQGKFRVEVYCLIIYSSSHDVKLITNDILTTLWGKLHQWISLCCAVGQCFNEGVKKKDSNVVLVTHRLTGLFGQTAAVQRRHGLSVTDAFWDNQLILD